MRVALMQMVDKYIGHIICFILSIFYRRKKNLPKKIRRVVVIKMWGIGSIVLMTPMLKALKEKYKGIEMSFITFTNNKAIPKIYDVTQNVYPIRQNSFLAFLFDTVKTILIIRRQRQDVVIDAEFFSRYTAVFSYLLRASYHIGFYRRDIYRGRMIDFQANVNAHCHMIENFFKLIPPFFYTKENFALYGPKIPAQAFKRLEEKLKNENMFPERPNILVNINVSEISPNIDRSWPLENFIEVVKKFHQDFNIIFIGESDQKERTQQAVDRCGDGAVSMAGKIDIEELIGLMKKSFLILTNDSGPLHLAVSVELPSISFFGTESPVLCGYDYKPHKVFWRGLVCSPCLSVFNYKQGKCKLNSRCMKEILVEPVIAYINEKLSEFWEHYEDRMKKLKENIKNNDF